MNKDDASKEEQMKKYIFYTVLAVTLGGIVIFAPDLIAAI
ncbi:MAG: hypothetical protein J07HQW2_00204 [Haloquadratum walsbyi J07HQW2]|jgi:hypothetical protein|uniref:Uncharacterized protein n=1 Tax=Haloquadratum walsbyi J07HQW2 TaxID=1238425 RepID=U1NAB4_9EURY|nr:MAG: hypothetical protein J07HQW2_00204 [Haloquadratum walsbyi J07HQW2]